MNLRELFAGREPRGIAQSRPAQPARQQATPRSKPEPRRMPGDFGIQWPKAPAQKVKDYKSILTVDELEAYLKRCAETGYCSFDWETAADKATRETWEKWATHYREQRDELLDRAQMERSKGYDTIKPENMTPKQWAAEKKRRQKEFESGIKVWEDKAKELDSEYKDRRKDYLKTPLDPWKGEICTVSLAAAPHEARVIPISHKAGNVFESALSRNEARDLVLDTLDRMLFRHSGIVKIAENLAFETKYAAKYGKYILMPVADPQVMRVRCMQVAFPGKIKNAKKPATGWGLKPSTKIVFGVNMGDFQAQLDKNEVDFFDEIAADSGDGLMYSAEDSDYGIQQYLFWLEVAKQIPRYEEWLHQIEMPFSRVIGLMEYHGMAWDTELAEMRRQEATAAQAAAAEEIKRICSEACGVEVNPGKTGKTNEVKDVLLNVMKIPTAGNTDAGNVSFDEEALINIKFMLENKLEDLNEEKYLTAQLPDGWDRANDPHEFDEMMASFTLTDEQERAIEIHRRPLHPYKGAALALIEQMTKIQKYTTLLSSHVDGREKWLNPRSGRIHAEYTPWTETSRLNAAKPNGQNVPRLENDSLKVRNMYIAPAGRILFFIDFAGFELRILAWKSGDEVLIDIFLHDGDMHIRTASSIADKPESEVTKKERTDAKPANFQMAYGGTEHALQKTILTEYGQRKSLEECAKMVEGRNKAYPGVKAYTEDVVIQAREDGYSSTAHGYIRLLPGINSPNKYERSSAGRQAMNTPIQGTAADFMKRAQNDVYDEIGRGTIEADLIEKYGYNDETTAGIEGSPPLVHGHTDMIAQIHDEIIFEMDDDPDVVEAAWHWVQDCMEREPLPGFPVPIKAEASVGYRWGEKMDVEKWLEERRAAQ